MGATQLADPLSYLPAPPTSNPPLPATTVVSWPNGIPGGTTLQTNSINIVSGDTKFKGNDTLTGTNVMIYLTNGATLDLSGNGAVSLSSMTSGPYQGITIFQDRSDTSGITLVGNGSLNITGAVYAPNSSVTAKGNGNTDVFGSQVIANSLSLTGNGTVNVNFDPNANAVPYTRSFGLVE